MLISFDPTCKSIFFKTNKIYNKKIFHHVSIIYILLLVPSQWTFWSYIIDFLFIWMHSSVSGFKKLMHNARYFHSGGIFSFVFPCFEENCRMRLSLVGFSIDKDYFFFINSLWTIQIVQKLSLLQKIPRSLQIKVCSKFSDSPLEFSWPETFE